MPAEAKSTAEPQKSFLRWLEQLIREIEHATPDKAFIGTFAIEQKLAELASQLGFSHPPVTRTERGSMTNPHEGLHGQEITVCDPFEHGSAIQWFDGFIMDGSGAKQPYPRPAGREHQQELVLLLERWRAAVGAGAPADDERPGAKTPAAVDGDWLTPMPLVELANRLGNIGTRKARSILKPHGLKNAGNRQLWTVRLDGMTAEMVRKLKGER